MDLPPANFTFFIDSQTGIKALVSALNQNNAGGCSRFSNNTTLFWVLGHFGVEGNERAVEGAKKGSELDLQRVVENINIPLSELYTVIDLTVMVETNRK